jgi:hypothetical protein
MFMDSFKNEYMLKDIDKLMIVSGSYCLSMLDTALGIVSNGGVFKIPDPSIGPPSRDKLIDRVSKYLGHHRQDSDVKEIVESIRSIVTGFKLKLSVPQSKNVDNVDTVIGEWKEFYTYLMVDYVEEKRVDTVKKVFEGSSNTIFELIGLLGYMCVADDISVFENNGSYFYTSEYCKTEAKIFFDKGQEGASQDKSEYKLTDSLTNKFYDKLKTLEINGKTIESLLTELDGGTCIHGIGNSFLRFYIGAYEATRVALPHVKYSQEHCKKSALLKILGDLGSFVKTFAPSDKTVYALIDNVINNVSNNDYSNINTIINDLIVKINNENAAKLSPQIKKSFINDYQRRITKILSIITVESTNPLKPVPDGYNCDVYDKMFQLAPYLVEAPEYIKKNTGIEYLTAVLFDKSRECLLQNNPVNHTILVFGYTNNPTTSTKCMYIRGNALTVYQKFNTIENYFRYERTPDYKIEDINNNHFSSFYNNFSNIKHLIDLVKIPFTFHKQRKQTFKVFLDYTLNMCRMMAAQGAQGVQAAGETKALKLSKLAQQEVFDLMEAEYVKQVPKYMTVIKLDKPEAKLKSYTNMHMWNSGFNATLLNTKGVKEIDPSNRDYYVDTLDNFVSLPYVIETDSTGSAGNKAVIKTPYTQQDITGQCQMAQLLGKMLINKTFDNIIPTLYVPTVDNILAQYRMFESYFRVVNGQDSEIRSMFKSTMAEKDYTSNDADKVNLLKLYDIDGVSVVRNFSKIDKKYDDFKQAIVKRLQLAIFIFYSKYYVELKGYPYYEKLISKFMSFNEIDEVMMLPTDKDVNQKKIVEMWGYILNDMVMSVCSEGMYQQAWQYHFTELNKEYFLLVQLGKQLGPDHMPTIPVKDVNNLINVTGYHLELYKADRLELIEKLIQNNKPNFDTRINMLNETFSYFENDELKLNSLGENNDHTESLPRAIEYAIKALLVREHQTRTQGGLLFVEKLINILCNSNIDIKDDEDKQDAINYVFTINDYTFENIYNSVFNNTNSDNINNIATRLASYSFYFI